MKRPAKKARNLQYTIRSVPEEVDQALRAQAKREGRSLNEVALEALTKGMNLSNGARIYRDLDFLIGTWREDPAFDEAIADMRRIDPELWR